MAFCYSASSADSDSDQEFKYPTDSSESEPEGEQRPRRTFKEYVESNPMVKNPQEASLLTEFLLILNEFGEKDRQWREDPERIGRERSMQKMMEELEEQDKVADMLSDLIKDLDKEIVIAKKIVQVAEKSAEFQWQCPLGEIPRFHHESAEFEREPPSGTTPRSGDEPSKPHSAKKSQEERGDIEEAPVPVVLKAPSSPKKEPGRWSEGELEEAQDVGDFEDFGDAASARESPKKESEGRSEGSVQQEWPEGLEFWSSEGSETSWGLGELEEPKGGPEEAQGVEDPPVPEVIHASSASSPASSAESGSSGSEEDEEPDWFKGLRFWSHRGSEEAGDTGEPKAPEEAQGDEDSEGSDEWGWCEWSKCSSETSEEFDDPE